MPVASSAVRARKSAAMKAVNSAEPTLSYSSARRAISRTSWSSPPHRGDGQCVKTGGLDW